MNYPCNCTWCGNAIPENILITSRNKMVDGCSCTDCKSVKRTTCSFRCMMDMKNFKRRIFGNKRLKSIKKPSNSALKQLLKVIPFMMMERRPMKPVAVHLTSLIRIKPEKKVGYFKKIEAIMLVQIKHTRTKVKKNASISYGKIKIRTATKHNVPIHVPLLVVKK